MSDMSELLIYLTKNERMSESLIFFERIAHSLILGQKTSDSLGNQMSEFPALVKRYDINILAMSGQQTAFLQNIQRGGTEFISQQ